MEIMKLEPVLKDYIWGGARLINDFGFQTDLPKVAESWMLSCHRDGQNALANTKFAGRTLGEVIESVGKEKLCGTKSLDFPYFPVLIKLIDAKDNLSIQVHPDNDYAQRVEGEFGKTEIWYVIDAEPGASLVYGFKDEISSEDFEKAIKENTLMNVLNKVEVNKGDLFFIEAGTVHAIGKGVLIAEIQQNSNSTYRVYDYGRVDDKGNSRELHIQKAIDVSKTNKPTHDIKPQGETQEYNGYSKQLLSSCDLFTVYLYNIENRVSLFSDETSFNHVLVIDGEGKINGISFKKGDSFFVPANYGEYNIDGNTQIIVTKI